MARYPVVLFDLDHTLLDSDESERLAYRHTCERSGLADPDPHFATYRRINGELWRAVERGELSPNEVKVRRFAEFTDAVGLDADPAAMAERFVDGLASFGELYPGARTMLDALLPHVTLGLVTNGIGIVQRRRLVRLDLDPDFAAVAISGELGLSKPAPAIFDHITAELELGADRDGLVMIGDSLTSDIAGAANAGIDSIWFNRHGAERPADAPPVTHEITDLAEIPGIVFGS